ncbi:MAG TPA: M12 family metallopeptidase [Bryobacteraceae bacterium]|nr:M12 family metallopeptidase [Bryobacteraceae bacterium]
MAYASSLWTFEKSGSAFVVPYTVVSDNPNRAAAITAFNTIFSGVIQWQPRASETDYVEFNFNPSDMSGACEANVGINTFSPPNMIGGSVTCDEGTVLHEMGHAIGLWHEMSRSDRDQYVTVNYNNVIKGSRSNFDIRQDNAQISGSFDYASVMIYHAFGFSRTGASTLESIPPGITFRGLPDGSSAVGTYSAGDIDAIKRLYGTAPTQVTVASNPPGLQVIVDSTPTTTPATFSWTVGSEHTLNVAAGLQTQAGLNFAFARWSDSNWTGTVQPSHTITVQAGIGTASNPTSSPATTVYTANFIQMMQFVSGSFPSGLGSVVASPAPQTIGSNQYLTARQATTFTASASSNPAYTFWYWVGSWYGIFEPYENGVTTQGFTNGDFQVQYTNSTPLTVISTNPANKGIGVSVDGTFNYPPDPIVASTWNGMGSHTLSVFTPQLPYSSDTEYIFTQWNDGNTSATRAVSTSAGVNYTASFTPSYRLTTITNPTCGGTIGAAPTSSTGFYTSGAPVTISETPNTGWQFTGWQYDLTGTGTSNPIAVSDETLVQGNFNTVSTPLTVTVLAPGYVTQGSAPLLTVRGTGFDPVNTTAFVGNVFHGVTVINSTELTIQLTTSDTATLGGVQVFIQNYPPGTFVCAVYAATPLFVISAASTPAPTVVSLTPVNGSGNATFTATVSDQLGYTDVSVVYLLFNESVSLPNACLVAYDAYDNLLLLFNDAGTALVPGNLTPGGTGTLSNTRCQIAAAGSSVTGAGNNLSFTVPITFLGGFVGTNNAYVNAVSLEFQGSGYQLQGTWGGNTDTAPTIPTGQISGGPGNPHTFSFTFNDASSAENILLGYVVFNEDLTLNNGCVVAYSAEANAIYLLNNAGTGLAGSITPGGAGTASNSQCTIASGGTASLAGATLTFPVNITFGATFGGLKNAWGYAVSSGGSSSSWVSIGSWLATTNVAPGTITAPAPTGSGDGPLTFQITYSDANGYLDLQDTFFLVNSSSTDVGGCEVLYVPAYNVAFLLNDAATGFVSGSVTPGVAGSPISNTHCSVSNAGATTGSGTNLTLPLQVTFTSFSGTKTAYGYAVDASGAASTFQTLRTLSLP